MHKHHLFNATFHTANVHNIQRCKREADYRFKASTDSYKPSNSHPSRARNRHPSAGGHPLPHRTCTKFIVRPQTSERTFFSSENILWENVPCVEGTVALEKTKQRGIATYCLQDPNAPTLVHMSLRLTRSDGERSCKGMPHAGADCPTIEPGEKTLVKAVFHCTGATKPDIFKCCCWRCSRTGSRAGNQ